MVAGWRGLAKAYRALNEPYAAEEAAREGRELSPDDAELWEILKWAFSITGY